MACNHPKFCAETPLLTDSGKHKFVMSTSPFITLQSAERQLKCHVPYDRDLMEFRNGDIILSNVLEVPCGTCIGCRLDYSRAWATRLVCEAQLYDNNYFLTLTLDDEHNHDLTKKEIQDFLKRFRKRYGNGIRFFLCVEYGEKSGRCHAHGIFMNMPILTDLVLYKPAGDNSLFCSNTLDQLWQMGSVKVGSFTYNSAGYIARYALKQSLNGQEGFLMMSRRPGIGKPYFDFYQDEIFKDDAVYGRFGSMYVAPIPDYFMKLREKTHPEQVKQLRIKHLRHAQDIKYNDLGFLNLDDPSLIGFYKDNIMKTKVLVKKGDI